MPLGLKRYQQTGDFHFITFSCYHRQPLLASPHAKSTFEQTLERVRQWYGLFIVGYVVMPEHVHLLISEPQRSTLAVALQMLKQITARRLMVGAPPLSSPSDRVGLNFVPQAFPIPMGAPSLSPFSGDRVGLNSISVRSFWQTRYYDFNVHSEKKRVEKLRYIHRNPARRGLVATPQDWPWSSFRHYATGLEGVVEIESERTAQRRERMGSPLRIALREQDLTPSPQRGDKDGTPAGVSS
jgi:putative transposase